MRRLPYNELKFLYTSGKLDMTYPATFVLWSFWEEIFRLEHEITSRTGNKAGAHYLASERLLKDFGIHQITPLERGVFLSGYQENKLDLRLFTIPAVLSTVWEWIQERAYERIFRQHINNAYRIAARETLADLGIYLG